MSEALNTSAASNYGTLRTSTTQHQSEMLASLEKEFAQADEPVVPVQAHIPPASSHHHNGASTTDIEAQTTPQQATLAAVSIDRLCRRLIIRFLCDIAVLALALGCTGKGRKERPLWMTIGAIFLPPYILFSCAFSIADLVSFRRAIQRFECRSATIMVDFSILICFLTYGYFFVLFFPDILCALTGAC